VNQRNPHRHGANSHARPSPESPVTSDPQFAREDSTQASGSRCAHHLDDSSIRSVSVPSLSEQRGGQVGLRAVPASAEPLSLTREEQQRFHTLYSEHFSFVFRNLRRLGVQPAATDDALQEVYLVVLRRLRDLQHSTHIKAWLFAIILRVASNQRRSMRRRGTAESLGEQSVASTQPGPFDLTARAQAAQFLHTFLSSLDDNRRAVFIMAELEQLTAPEIAEVLAANLNTVYSWLRTARLAFSKALEQMHAAGGANHG
jgi:RNA polymerase sigma-70 factor (ECF subfamily)